MYCSMVVGALNELCVDHWRLGAWSVSRVTMGESHFCEIRMSESGNWLGIDDGRFWTCKFGKNALRKIMFVFDFWLWNACNKKVVGTSVVDE